MFAFSHSISSNKLASLHVVFVASFLSIYDRHWITQKEKRKLISTKKRKWNQKQKSNDFSIILFRFSFRIEESCLIDAFVSMFLALSKFNIQQRVSISHSVSIDFLLMFFCLFSYHFGVCVWFLLQFHLIFASVFLLWLWKEIFRWNRICTLNCFELFIYFIMYFRSFSSWRRPPHERNIIKKE